MPLPVRFHPEAEHEFLDGARVYRERFVRLLESALALIVEMPHAWPTWPGRPHIHRRVVTKLPYAIVYSVDQNSIFCHRRGAHPATPGILADPAVTSSLC